MALDTYRQLARIKAAPPRLIAAHYLCEIATLAIDRGDIAVARSLLRQARQETTPFPRSAVLRAQIAEREGDSALAVRLLKSALREAPKLLQEELKHMLALAGMRERDAVLAELVALAETHDFSELKHLVFAAIAAGLESAAPLRAAIETVFAKDPTLNAVWAAGSEQFERIAREIGALLAHAERYRCSECGFAGRSFYWHCPACQSWDSFESYTIVKLR
jgi:lipopolysaccharide biosynthesis regulator YciM